VILGRLHDYLNYRESPFCVITIYEVIRVPLHQTGHATGEYEDFLTGFVLPNGEVWGRPVGITVAADGSLLVSDDGSGSIWRVSYGK
jgi:glucose/arabinose dehydrogenase